MNILKSGFVVLALINLAGCQVGLSNAPVAVALTSSTYTAAPSEVKVTLESANTLRLEGEQFVRLAKINFKATGAREDLTGVTLVGEMRKTYENLTIIDDGGKVIAKIADTEMKDVLRIDFSQLPIAGQATRTISVLAAQKVTTNGTAPIGITEWRTKQGVGHAL